MINKYEFSSILKKIGVKKGDGIFLHVDALVTAFLEGRSYDEKFQTLYESMLITIGSNGTLVMPTFTYSSFKDNKFFDKNNSRSEVGLITETFRNLENVVRSSNPVFSVAAIGNLANVFANSTETDCYGENTCFDLILKHNFWIFTLGCSFDRVTFIHYVEQAKKVSYRFFKNFPSEIQDGEIKKNIVTSCYVRDLSRKTSVKLDRLRDKLKEKNLMKSDNIGRANIMGVKSKDFFSVATSILESKENALIIEGNH